MMSALNRPSVITEKLMMSILMAFATIDVFNQGKQ